MPIVATAEGANNGLASRPTLLWVAWIFVFTWPIWGYEVLLAPVAVLLMLVAGSLSRRQGWAAVLLVFACIVAFYGEVRERRFGQDWNDYWPERQSDLAAKLSSDIDRLVGVGDEAVGRVLSLPDGLPGAELSDSLAAVRATSELDALAVIGPDGRLKAWTGRHHGRLPRDVIDSGAGYSFFETPLFSYLYFVGEGSSGDRVFGAALMEVNLPQTLGVEAEGFAAAFES